MHRAPELDIERRFCSWVQCSLPQDIPVLVALSGGLDSICLLDLCRRFCRTPLAAAHYDHNQRQSSSRDAAFCHQHCQQLGVAYFGARAPGAHSRTSDRARQLRYAFLYRAAASWGGTACAILTAHQAEDRLEGFLLALARNRSLLGNRELPRVLRPLQECTRSELEEYARTRCLNWREDPSNQNPAYSLRNHLRLQILPQLDRIGLQRQRAAEHLSDLEQTLQWAHDQIARIADPDGAALRWDQIAQLPTSLQHQAIRLFCGTAGQRASRQSIAAILACMQDAQGTRNIALPGQVVEIRYGELYRQASQMQKLPETRIDGCGTFELGAKKVRLRFAQPDEPAHSIGIRDSDFPLQLGSRQPGDRIGSRKLKRILIDHRIPRSERDQLVVLRTSDRRIVYVERIGTLTPTPAGAREYHIEILPHHAVD